MDARSRLKRRAKSDATLHPSPAVTLDDDLLKTSPGLLTAFREGRREALAQVFRCYAPLLARRLRAGVVVKVDGAPTRLASRLAHADLEAVIQEVFVRAFQETARRGFDGDRPYLPYLTAIARNLLIDDVRKHRRRRTVLVEDVDEMAGDLDPDGSPSGPAHEAQEGELRAALDEAVAELPPRDREVFRLRFVERLGLEEVAEAAGISVSTVRRTEARLRVELLEKLQARGHLSDRGTMAARPLSGSDPDTRKRS